MDGLDEIDDFTKHEVIMQENRIWKLVEYCRDIEGFVYKKGMTKNYLKKILVDDLIKKSEVPWKKIIKYEDFGDF